MQAKIQKWGNSQGIRIPKQILENLKLQVSDLLSLEVEGNKIILEKQFSSKPKNIMELFENFDGEYEKITVDWGEPMGDEIW